MKKANEVGVERLYVSDIDYIDLYHEASSIDSFFFSGFNANIGLLWTNKVRSDKDRQLKIGLVLKMPFTADLIHERTIERTTKPINKIHQNNHPVIKNQKTEEKLNMPMSYGIGCFYRFSDKFKIGADIYRTEWQDFILTDSDGKKRTPITNKSPDESDIKATYQIRMGAEYLFYKRESRYVFPFRAGLFYDPSPTKGGYDEYYGLSLGVGIKGKNDDFEYALDVAYQYRFGNDVGTSISPEYGLTQDLDEHMLYLSCIIRLIKGKNF